MNMVSIFSFLGVYFQGVLFFEISSFENTRFISKYQNKSFEIWFPAKFWQVLMCSPIDVPNSTTTTFYPISFAHNYPLFTSISGLIWNASQNRNFYFGSFQIYIYIFWEWGGDGSFIPNDGSWKKVKIGLNLENPTLLIKIKKWIIKNYMVTHGHPLVTIGKKFCENVARINSISLGLMNTNTIR